MDYSFIEGLSFEQLNSLSSAFANEDSRNEFIKELEEVIVKKKAFDERKEPYYSIDTIPYYDENLEDRCLHILENMTMEKFLFLTRSFYEKGNKIFNLMGPALDYLSDCFEMSVYSTARVLQNPNYCGFGISLSSFEKFFSEEYMVKNYNNTFNIYNYIKSYIYQCLSNDKESTSKDIFKDYSLKQFVVERDLQRVANYLYQLRGNGDLRCSVANAGLSRTAKKVSGEVTFHQRRLIEAVAFGTTLEKLNNRNYEDSKKLIYLP